MSIKDPVFAGMLAEQRTAQARLTETVDGLERQLRRGGNRIEASTIAKVGTLLSGHLRDPLSPLRRTYVRSFIGSVIVSPTRIAITGSQAALEAAVLASDKMAAAKVPSFDREWCRLGDSNT